MTARAFFVLLCLAGGIKPAIAVDFSFEPNAAEMLRMPSYCQARFKSAQGSPEWNAWRGRIGENFIDLHHYCAGLNYVNRYWGARSTTDRNFFLQRAMTNFDYMVKAEKPDFTLRAELYSNRGEVFKLMRRPGEAIKDYNKALSIDPQAVKPYLQLADLYVASKGAARALEIVTEGLRQMPDSAALQRRYLELGGKKPFPDPVAVKTTEPTPQASVESTPAPEPAVAPAVPSEAKSLEATTEPPPPIGSTKNPYCRFCPPE